jgi:hypothetical protein
LNDDTSSFVVTNTFDDRTRYTNGDPLDLRIAHDSDIDWQALEKFSKSVTIPELSNASKLAHNWLPLGQRRQLLEADDEAKLQASLCLLPEVKHATMHWNPSSTISGNTHKVY